MLKYDMYIYDVIIKFCALIILRGEKGTLEHLAQDEVAIARQVGSILIVISFLFLLHYDMYWIMTCESGEFVRY